MAATKKTTTATAPKSTAYNSAANGGVQATAGPTPGSGGLGVMGQALAPATGAGKLEREATTRRLYFADVPTGSPSDVRKQWERRGLAPPASTSTRQQVHSGKYIFDLLNWTSDPGQIKALQQQLYLAGYYGGSFSFENLRLGDKNDPATREALARAVIDISARQDRGEKGTFFDVLKGSSQYASANAVQSMTSNGRAPFSPIVASAADIRAELDADAPEIVGHRLSDREINNIIKSFQNAQLKAQRRQYDTTVTGGTTEEPPSLQTFAKEQIRATDPTGAKANDFAKAAAIFLDVLQNRSVETATF